MLNMHQGRILAMIKDSEEHDGEFIYVDEEYEKGAEEIELSDGHIIPLMNLKAENGIYYIAGPAGSGKSTYAARLIKNFMSAYPKTNVIVFSRTNIKNDPAFNDMRMIQMELNDNLLENPINIETDIQPNSILFFDDCNTIQNIKINEYLEKLMIDVMECGRKLQINIILTNHLIIPLEKKFARIVMNEVQYLTVFVKTGSQQIKYVLKTHFGLSQSQVDTILSLNSRWVTVVKIYPMLVIYEDGVYIL
jgi:hypothetical protein